MPLSEHEQRILAEIERRLLEEDPKFAHHVGSTFQAHLSRRLKLAAAGFVVGLIVLVAGFAQNVALGVAGFVIMLVAIFEFVRTLRRRATVEQRPQPPGKAGTEAPPSRPSSPSGGIESWWGRMTERWRQRWEERGGPPPP
jgi:Protein of unknown function (DUF3040)